MQKDKDEKVADKSCVIFADFLVLGYDYLFLIAI